MRGRRPAVLLLMVVFVAGACSDGDDGGPQPETVSATEYLTGVCGSVASWVEEIQGLNEDLSANLDPTSLESVKESMLGFLDDVIASTNTVIDEVEGVGVPDVENGAAAAETILTGLRESRGVFEDARDRVDAMATDDPAAFTQELQAMGTDLQTSLSDIGEELETFEVPDLDEASEDVPECDEAALA